MFVEKRRSSPTFSFFHTSTSTTMSKPRVSKAAPAHPLINAAVNDTRRKGELFLPASKSESQALFTLLPGFRSALPSIFSDPRYQVSDSMSTEIFTVDPVDVSEGDELLPDSYYPISLVEECPPLSKIPGEVSYAEGRLLFLALSYVIEVVHPALDVDPETKLVMSSVTDKHFFKQCLGLAEPVLVSPLLFFHFSFSTFSFSC